MLKTIATALIATPLVATTASAGTYLNVESNTTFLGSDYVGTLVENHVGYEVDKGDFTFYLQGGPALVSLDDVDNEVVFSAKVGANVDATENLNFYGEYTMVTGEDLYSNVELGAKYTF